ncbi:phosphopantetheine-binding protein [Streptomyces sp. BK022]|uniref:phosphopantetheine-binding protein n=1 Tax=Streptomyces sp. BK022 TaxID=2512123 RepID=UPI0013EEEB65|nr:phosphopantetheine-binding protein [Streptomyces sp. BK022]
MEKILTGDLAARKSLDVVLAAAHEAFGFPVTADDNFFDLDGDSLQAVDFAVQVEEILGKEIDLAMLFDAENFGEFADFIDGADRPVAES